MATEKTEKEWKEEHGEAPTESEGWGQEVAAESQISLEMEGEGFIARFLGMDPANANGIVQGHFSEAESLDGIYIGDAFMNIGRDLIRKLSKVPVKREVRIQWVSSMQTGQATPMRVYSVQWR